MAKDAQTPPIAVAMLKLSIEFVIDDPLLKLALNIRIPLHPGRLVDSWLKNVRFIETAIFFIDCCCVFLISAALTRFMALILLMFGQERLTTFFGKQP